MVVWSVNLRAHLHHFKILSMLTLATIRFFFSVFVRAYTFRIHITAAKPNIKRKKNGDHEMREESKGKKLVECEKKPIRCNDLDMQGTVQHSMRFLFGFLSNAITENYICIEIRLSKYSPIEWKSGIAVGQICRHDI